MNFVNDKNMLNVCDHYAMKMLAMNKQIDENNAINLKTLAMNSGMKILVQNMHEPLYKQMEVINMGKEIKEGKFENSMSTDTN